MGAGFGARVLEFGAWDWVFMGLGACASARLFGDRVLDLVSRCWGFGLGNWGWDWGEEAPSSPSLFLQILES